MPNPRVQIDYVLQKQHLTHPENVHETMYMPSHTEYLVEIMCRMGFKPGMSFGIDDFALRGQLLNHSSAEVLMVCGVDQHLNREFMTGWKQVKRDYAVKILVVSEPIYSPLAFYIDKHYSAQAHHEKFLAAFVPDIVLYLSAYDVQVAREKHTHQSLLYSLADGGLIHFPVLPWEKKRDALLWLGKTTAWEYTRRKAQWPERLSREDQLRFLGGQEQLPVSVYTEQLTFRECYEMANHYRFQIQPLSGFVFHSARAVQAALLQSIPILLLHPDDAELLRIEAPFVKPDHNCLVSYEGDHSLFKKIRDTGHMQHVASHVSELLEGGTIQSCLRTLGQLLFRHFYPQDGD